MLGGFLSVPYLVDIYTKNMDERGRNFMCKRTLLSLLIITSTIAEQPGRRISENEEFGDLETIWKLK